MSKFKEYADKLFINKMLGWTFLIVGICAISPLPYDPIPFFGAPVIPIGIILLLTSLYCFFPLRHNLLIQITFALADENQGQFTKNMLIEELDIAESTAKWIMRYFRRHNLARVVRRVPPGSPDGLEIDYYLIID